MTAHTEFGRLVWLNNAWAFQRHIITRLLGRIGDLGVVQAMKPKIFMKLMRLLEQVAAAKAEEVRLISEIDAIERKHRFHRKHGLLKRVAPEDEDKAKVTFEAEDEEKECDDECARPGIATWWTTAQQLYGFLAACDLSAPAFQPQPENETLMVNTITTPPPVTSHKPSNWLLWLVVLWYLMSRPAIAPRSQGLTAD